ncbi:MAG: hypothetical protein QGF12_03735 [SAR202 cluster bacterium]|jgi:nicotinamide mononucleotide (NMN) deamidase PncC|nr:hypothetical protein [SAR202 cluster bacterium]|tara:strand:+ start:52 stop:1203 length:1152 start_codon:yes stop_codon:yes gene_type:complete
MDADIKRQIDQLHAGSAEAVISLTGGGSQALNWLLATPGASGTILEAVVPYSNRSLATYLGYKPERIVTPSVAMDMARIAYQRGLSLSGDNGFLVGVGCSAAIVTDREKKGAHRCFTVAWTREATTRYSLTMTKGVRDRQEEDQLVSKIILRSLVETTCVPFNIPIELNDEELIEIDRQEHPDLFGQLLTGQIKTVTVLPDGTMLSNQSLHGGVLPGSFDPLHKGHESLSGLASGILQAPVTYELSVSNVDKAPLAPSVLQTRVAQFRNKGTVVLTNAPKFNEKADLFPGCAFVIGLDTAARLFDPLYYHADAAITASLRKIKDLGCRFLVAGRVHEGAFRTLGDIRVPTEFLDIFTPLSEDEFRDDVSSTAMRSCEQFRRLE